MVEPRKPPRKINGLRVAREIFRKNPSKGVDPPVGLGRFLPAARKWRRERRRSIAVPKEPDRLFSPLERRSFTSMARPNGAGPASNQLAGIVPETAG
jgi:hypothetical protein